MHFDRLVECQRQDQLSVAIRFQISAARFQTMLIRVIISLVQAFRLVFLNEGIQVHLEQKLIVIQLVGFFGFPYHSLDSALLILAGISVKLFDLCFQSFFVGSGQSCNLGLVSHQNEGWHGRDSISSSRFTTLINVNVEKMRVGILDRELVNEWSNVLARPAPENWI